MDGTADYTNLSDAELAQAKVRADPTLAPVDFDNLGRELRRRRRLRAAARLPLVLKIIGAFLVLGAIVGATGLRVVTFQPTRILFPLLILPLILWAAAGVSLLRGKPAGVPLGIAALGLQLVSFAAGGVSYAFVPLVGVSIAWHGGHVLLQFSAGSIGYLRMEQIESVRFAVDAVPLVGLYYLIRSLWSRDRATRR